MRGKLTIFCERADIFIDTEWMGKMDPFVTFTQTQTEGIAPFKHETAVQKSAGKKPIWKETFDIAVTNMDLKLTVHLQDYEGMKTHDDLGKFDITPREFMKNPAPTNFRAFIGPKNTSVLYMTGTWVPDRI